MIKYSAVQYSSTTYTEVFSTGVDIVGIGLVFMKTQRRYSMIKTIWFIPSPNISTTASMISNCR